jgi:hypothetical protein
LGLLIFLSAASQEVSGRLALEMLDCPGGSIALVHRLPNQKSCSVVTQILRNERKLKKCSKS